MYYLIPFFYRLEIEKLEILFLSSYRRNYMVYSFIKYFLFLYKINLSILLFFLFLMYNPTS
jgi:hypothetical protein